MPSRDSELRGRMVVASSRTSQHNAVGAERGNSGDPSFDQFIDYVPCTEIW